MGVDIITTAEPRDAIERRAELGSAARGGLVTFAGAALSALLGFALSFLFARLLGAYGAGVVLQAVAVFTIAMSFAKLGLDTAAIWLLPRLMVEDRTRVRSAVVALLVPACLGAALLTGGWLVTTTVLDSGSRHDPVRTAITAVALFLPAASVMTVALAATRAFGGVLAFNVIGNVLVPLLRPLALLAVVATGGTATAAALGWAAPWLLGAACAVWVLVHQVRAATRACGGSWRPSRATVREIGGYCLPRTLMSGLEQAVIWLDVVLVGAMLGSAQAGVYGSAARFVSAGVIVFTAIRIVVAPRFSALLAGGRQDALEHLYGVTGRWILLFGAPVYIVLAVFAPTVLGWLGAGFEEGTASMVVLCLGSLSILAAGNVQALLLMSGHIGWGVANKVVVVAVNVVLNLVLIPRLGIVGSALAWAVSMAVDNALAAYQVRRALRIGPELGAVLHVAVVVGCCVAAPAVLVEAVLGQGVLPLAIAAVGSGALLLAGCAWDRDRLALRGLLGPPPAAAATTSGDVR